MEKQNHTATASTRSLWQVPSHRCHTSTSYHSSPLWTLRCLMICISKTFLNHYFMKNKSHRWNCSFLTGCLILPLLVLKTSLFDLNSPTDPACSGKIPSHCFQSPYYFFISHGSFSSNTYRAIFKSLK